MRKWLGLAVGIGLIAASFGTACSSTAPTPNADVTTFCANKAKAECQIASTCVIPNATCLTVREAVCQDEAQAATADGTRSYYQPNAQACLNKVQSAYSGAMEIPFSDLYGTGSIDDLCNRVFQGDATNNTACTSNYDCVNGEVCTLEGTGPNMLCGTTMSVAAGGFCGEPGQQCATGTYCASASGGSPTCATRPGLGAACNVTSEPCLETLRCVGGACTARATTGQTCDPNRVPGDPNADCDPTSAPLCDTSDPSAGDVCTAGLFTIARGADDCTAYSTLPGATMDAGAVDSGIAPPDSGQASDSGTASDAGTLSDAGKD